MLSRHPLRGDAVRRRTACVGGVLVIDRRVLLGLRTAHRAEFAAVWDVPGGHVDAGESPRRALVRELREELNIDAVVGPPWRRFVDDELAVELDVWLLRDWRGSVVNAAPEEHSELRWCDAAEVSELALAHPALRPLLLDALDAG